MENTGYLTLSLRPPASKFATQNFFGRPQFFYCAASFDRLYYLQVRQSRPVKVAITATLPPYIGGYFFLYFYLDVTIYYTYTLFREMPNHWFHMKNPEEYLINWMNSVDGKLDKLLTMPSELHAWKKVCNARCELAAGASEKVAKLDNRLWLLIIVFSIIFANEAWPWITKIF